jgi:hypothetical protein
MQLAHNILLTMLLIFAGLQINDPDWYYWGPVYLLAAYWSYLAANEPGRFTSWPIAQYGAPVCIVLFLIGFVSLLPYVKSGWIHIEEARECFGYLICAATTAFAVWSSRRQQAAV